MEWISAGFGEGNNNNRCSEIHAINRRNEIVAIGSYDDTLSLQGNQLISNGSRDFYIVNYDVYGNIKWVNSFGGPEFESAYDIKINQQDEIFITLGIHSSFDFDGQLIDYSNGGSVLLKLDPNGKLLWYKQGGRGASGNAFSRVAIDQKDNIILLGGYGFGEPTYFGYTFQDLPYAKGVFVIKLNADGDHIWHETGITYRISPGLNEVAIDRYNDIIITASCFSFLTLGEEGMTESRDGNKAIIKFDEDGDMLWFRTCGPTPNNDTFLYEHFNGLLLDDENNIYVGGEYCTEFSFFGKSIDRTYGEYHGYLAKLDSVCQLVWFKSFEGRNVGINDLTWNNQGDLVVAGGYRDSIDLNNFSISENGTQSLIFLANTAGLIKNAYSSSGTYSRGISINVDHNNDLVLSGLYQKHMIWHCDSSYSEGSATFIMKLGNNDEILDLNLISKDSLCISSDSTFDLSIKRYQRFSEYQWFYPTALDSVSYSYTYPYYNMKLKYNEIEDSLSVKVVLTEICGVTIHSPPYLKKIEYTPEKPHFTSTVNALCENDSAVISIQPIHNAANYLWKTTGGLSVQTDSTNIPENIIFVNSYNSNKGDVLVAAKNICGVSPYDTLKEISMMYLPKLDSEIIGEANICANQQYLYQIQSAEADLNYHWAITNQDQFNTHIDSESISIEPIVENATGELSVSASNICGISESVYQLITVLPLPREPRLIKNECEDLLIVETDYPGEWYYNGEQLSMDADTIQAISKGRYYFEAANSCGLSSSKILDIYPPNADEVFIPNIITPNGDDKNDYLILNEALIDSHFSLYNRYGKKVYESLKYSNDFNGSALSNGTYYYMISHKCFNDYFKGTLTIMR